MPEEKALIIDEWEDRNDSKRLHLEPCHKEIRNGIVEPEEVVVFSQYFLKKWGPRLGPTLTLLIIRLRMYCYYNKRTKEKRDWCFPSQKTLAEDLGVSSKTIERELKREIAREFIKRKPRYVYNQKLNKKIRNTGINNNRFLLSEKAGNSKQNKYLKDNLDKIIISMLRKVPVVRVYKNKLKLKVSFQFLVTKKAVPA